MNYSIENLSAYTSISPAEINTYAKGAEANKQNNVLFEKILNQMLVKEMLTPVINGSLLGKGGSYGFLLQDTLTNYLSENVNIFNQTNILKEGK